MILRTLVLISVLMVLASGFVAAGGLLQNNADRSIPVGSTRQLYFTVVGDNVSKTFEFFAKTSSSFILLDGGKNVSQNVTVGTFAKVVMAVNVTGVAPGDALMMYGIKDASSGSGLGFQTVTQRIVNVSVFDPDVVVNATNIANVTSQANATVNQADQAGSLSSLRSSGGGGGGNGGYVPLVADVQKKNVTNLSALASGGDTGSSSKVQDAVTDVPPSPKMPNANVGLSQTADVVRSVSGQKAVLMIVIGAALVVLSASGFAFVRVKDVGGGRA